MRQHTFPATPECTSYRYLSSLSPVSWHYSRREPNVPGTSETKRDTEIVPNSYRPTRKNKLLLFRAVLRPILLYGILVWDNSSKTRIRKLPACLRLALTREQYTRIRDLHQNRKIQYVSEFVDRTSEKNTNFRLEEISTIKIDMLKQTSKYRMRYSVSHVVVKGTQQNFVEKEIKGNKRRSKRP